MSMICLLIASENSWLPNKSVLGDGGLRCDKLFSMLCRKLSNLVHFSKYCLLVSTALHSHKGLATIFLS